jgi:hypothetical protein
VKDFDFRALVIAVQIGTLIASVVFTISVLGDFPRVWPGTVTSFLLTTCSSYLGLTKRRTRR